jgi:hypothetical protein
MDNIIIWVVMMAILIGAFVALGGIAKSLRSNPERENKAWMPRLGQFVVLALGLFHAASTSFFYVDKLETGHIVKRFMGSEMPKVKSSL